MEGSQYLQRIGILFKFSPKIRKPGPLFSYFPLFLRPVKFATILVDYIEFLR